MLGKEAPKSMIEKAIIATAFSFVLSNFGPIDNWLVLTIKGEEKVFYNNLTKKLTMFVMYAGHILEQH